MGRTCMRASESGRTGATQEKKTSKAGSRERGAAALVCVASSTRTCTYESRPSPCGTFRPRPCPPAAAPVRRDSDKAARRARIPDTAPIRGVC
jgi:hypothetical protein